MYVLRKFLFLVILGALSIDFLICLHIVFVVGEYYNMKSVCEIDG